MAKASRKAKVVIILAVLAVATGGYFTYKEYLRKSQMAKTTSTAETAQNNYSSGPKRDTVTNSDSSQGGATDNNGQLPSGTPQSDAAKSTSSQSGNITLNTPYSGSTIENGATIAGSAKLNNVQYRLVDNSVGVIAQGQLSVVDGAFSGTLHFAKKSSSGKLVVYSYDPQTGAEINRIEIDIKF